MALIIISTIALLFLLHVSADATLVEANPDDLFLGMNFANTVDDVGAPVGSFLRIGVAIVSVTYFFKTK